MRLRLLPLNLMVIDAARPPEPALSLSERVSALSLVYAVFVNPSRMLIFLTTLLAALRAILRSRGALELENLALRHQIGVLHRSATKPEIDRRKPPIVDRAVPHLA